MRIIGVHLFFETHIICLSGVKAFERATGIDGVVFHFQSGPPLLVNCDPNEAWELLEQFFNWEMEDNDQ